MSLTIVAAYLAAVVAGGGGFLVSTILLSAAPFQPGLAGFLFVGMLLYVPFAALMCLPWFIAMGILLRFLGATGCIWFAGAGALVAVLSFAVSWLSPHEWQSLGSGIAAGPELLVSGTLAGWTYWRIAIRGASARRSNAAGSGRLT